jgi:HlyD family secretion protein
MMNNVKRFGYMVALSACALSSASCQASPSVIANNQTALKASGTIHATEIHVASELGGRVVEVRAKEGTSVQMGDTLVTLDDTPWTMQLNPAKAAVNSAQADLDVIQAKPRVEAIAAAQAAVDLAAAQRDGAQRAWQDAQAQVDSPQDLDTKIIEAQTKVKQAAQGVELAKAELAKAQTLRDRGTVKRQAADWQVQAAQESLGAAQADAKTAQIALDQLQQIRNKPLAFIAAANAAKGKYEIAQSAYAMAKAKQDDLLAGATPEEIAVAQATVRKAKAEANVANVKVIKSTLASPLSGVVLSQALKPGELAAPAVTILTLADLHEVTLDVYVPENRIGQVKLGQGVNVSVDSFAGKVFVGRVSHIGNSPEFTPRNVATAEERLNTFFVVEIKLANDEGLLKPGMPADATFK